MFDLAHIKMFFLKVAEFMLPLVVFLFDPLQYNLVMALWVLMILDTIVGTYYAYNVDKYSVKEFLSKALAKIFKYFGAAAFAHVLEYFLVGIPYTQELDTYVFALLAITEAKSFYSYLNKFGLELPIIPKLEDFQNFINKQK